MTDGELVRRVVAGETAAYGELARRWFRRILAMCQSRVCSSDADDLAQDVFMRGYARLSTLSNSEQFGSWLRGIAHNVCVDWCRNRARREQALGIEHRHEELAEVPDNIGGTLADDERAVIFQQISAIPEDLREVVLLRYYDNLTYDEMAQWLGVARATVNERLAKARALLRIRLAKLRSDV